MFLTINHPQLSNNKKEMVMSDRMIGLSTGSLAKILSGKTYTVMLAVCSVFSDVVEFNLHTPEVSQKVLGSDKIKILTKSFNQISLHLPSKNVRYSLRNEIARAIMRDVERFQKNIFPQKISHLVVHPDLVDDWEFFEKVDIPVAIENMDVGQMTSLSQLCDFFDEYPEKKMVVDISHWIMAGNSLTSLSFLNKDLGDRIVGIHLSGVRAGDRHHYPLVEAESQCLVKALSMFSSNIPIILEGVFETDPDPDSGLGLKSEVSSKTTFREISQVIETDLWLIKNNP